ncbi:alpha-L-rhamnosidase-related protein [Flavilitoribacter nigricans]|uniref:Glycogen debranching protein n=1 Tax=Flavilitoribacter nigricans (strain ATCC 23147 / DSM 23189 / NBRC 102662 / NCIMB 1420 / SS-2) TaxID=1122177 RepID=A0A2D0N6G1_FLAN2|nr:family 78 glycoside hydrolase catalytic domain [Flavilitoribacter nigricans]PHN03966.1 glycogen debranching protein [Flavilitoribacter nigricans DSM 23189 = NBRC 102662]
MSSSSETKTLFSSDAFTLYSDRIVQGRYSARAIAPDHLVSNYPSREIELLDDHDQDSEKSWKLTEDLSRFPQYRSDQPLVDTLYQLSLEEAHLNIEPDGTFRTGAEWGGVWTRDISYSILLAFAFLEPEVSKTSLRKKVRRGMIIQDTGSGGAWPVSSDRTTWVLAAWEIYQVTGDAAWLDEVYPIIKNTLEDDYKTLFDAATGMFCGESSFLDWREQTYPRWMSNADIYTSLNLGTNVVHYQAHKILAAMARIKGESTDVFSQRADLIRDGINKYLWQKDVGYYGQYLYGRSDLIRSPRFETLGESLAILFGVADQAQTESIINNAPLTPYGLSCIYPQIPNIPAYHNNGIWPFVQAYWNLAAARAGNLSVLNHGLASIYRPAALFLTNYENMVAETGDFRGTEINSHRMLWSIAGNLAMVYRVFLGMSFGEDGLHFTPAVPESYGGVRTLSGFHYRNAVLDISVSGWGRQIKTFTLDGQEQDRAMVPPDLSGHHKITIVLEAEPKEGAEARIIDNYFSLPAPRVIPTAKSIEWESLPGATHYKVYRNGEFWRETKDTEMAVGTPAYAVYQVEAVDARAYPSFASEPVTFAKDVRIIPLEAFVAASPLPFTDFTGDGFVEVSLDKNRVIDIPVEIEKAGNYLLDIRYANGSGPWNTDNKCAIRSLSVNDAYTGVMVFPQRGTDAWSDWGYSNVRKIQLQTGTNQLKLHFEEWNHNMNVEINRAMLDHIRIIAID